MKRFRRVLACIDLNGIGAATAAGARDVARAHGARLALAHVVDYGAGLEADHAPFLTRAETEARLDAVVRRHLATLAWRLGQPDARLLVGFGGPEQGLRHLASGWQPDLVVVGAPTPHGVRHDKPLWLHSPDGPVACDTLVLPPPTRPRRFGLWGLALRLVGPR